MTKANERLVLDMFRAVEERDSARMLELYAPDVEFVWPPSLPSYGGTYRGPDVLKMGTDFAAVWDPLQPTEEARRIHARVIGSNDTEVVVLYHQRGVDLTGRTCDIEVIGLYRVEADKVARLQMFYFDPEHVGRFLTAASDRSEP